MRAEPGVETGHRFFGIPIVFAAQAAQQLLDLGVHVRFGCFGWAAFLDFFLFHDILLLGAGIGGHIGRRDICHVKSRGGLYHCQ